MSDFIPRIIGSQDTVKYQNIHDLYSALIISAAICKPLVESLFNITPIPLDTIFSLIRKNEEDMRVEVRQNYWLGHNHYYDDPTFDSLSSPLTLDHSLFVYAPLELETWVDQWKEINKIIAQIEIGWFIYPLRNLYSEIDGWSLTEEFENQLIQFTTRYTKSDEQNTICDIIQRYCDVLNDLANLNIVKLLGNNYETIGKILKPAINVDYLSDTPFSLSPNMFKDKPFSRFSISADLYLNMNIFS